MGVNHDDINIYSKRKKKKKKANNTTA